MNKVQRPHFSMPEKPAGSRANLKNKYRIHLCKEETGAWNLLFNNIDCSDFPPPNQTLLHLCGVAQANG
jgi:hypothetical protein